jgi:hypothetical protein
VVLTALASAALVPGGNRESLDPRSTGENGSRAVAQVLRAHGIGVEAVQRSDDAVRDAGTDVSLVVVRTMLLGPAQLDRLRRTDADLVLVEPDLTTLRALAPQVVPAGPLDHDRNADPSCADPDAAAAGRVHSTGSLYRFAPGATSGIVDTTAGPEPVGCYPGHEPDGYGLLRVSTDGHQVTVLGLSDVLRNRALPVAGNAALALRLLGARPQLRWYLPDAAELGQDGGGPTLDELQPRWLNWVLWQLVIAAAIALVWRARRLGPVVGEPLPVVVRSAETREGRARLYRQGRTRARAAAVLRTAVARRLAGRLGVPAQAPPEEVARQAAHASGLDEAAVRQTLLGPAPVDDAGLVRLAAALDEVERRVIGSADRYRGRSPAGAATGPVAAGAARATRGSEDGEG